jgi:hypothetical protein
VGYVGSVLNFGVSLIELLLGFPRLGKGEAKCLVIGSLFGESLKEFDYHFFTSLPCHLCIGSVLTLVQPDLSTDLFSHPHRRSPAWKLAGANEKRGYSDL